MRRTPGVVIAVAVVLGACAVSVSDETSPPAPTAVSSTTAPVPPPSQPTTTVPAPGDGWYVVSVTAELPDELVSGLALLDGVEVVSVVRVENRDLTLTRRADGSVADRAPSGFFFPLEVQAIDALAHSEYVPEPVGDLLTGLGPDEVALSTSSAVFRDLGPGGTLVLDDGSELTVEGVVDDEWIGAAEAAVSSSGGEALGIALARYAVVRFDGSRDELKRAAESLTDAAVHVRSRDEVDLFRHADAVAPQIAIKQRFGEFAYRPTEGDFIEIDPAWLDANIVEVEIPLLGNDKCHREFVAMLSEIMLELEHSGQAEAIDPSAYLGCWNSRFIRGRKDFSRHAWGIAADINFGNGPDGGPGSPTHPALLAAMRERDILSGHLWTDPDPGHFEWFGDPP